MSDKLKVIITILDEECRLYSDILELSKKKTDIINKGHVNELDKIVKLEQTLVFEVGRLGEKRQEIIESYKKERQFEGELTITALIDVAMGEDKRNLENIKRALEESVKEQKRVNLINEKLIKNNLEYIDFFLNTYTGQNVGGNVYEKDGHSVEKVPKRNLFDTSI